MTTFEYVLNFALVGLVVLQIRGIKLTKVALLLPVVMTAWIASQILQAIPTGGNDLVLELGFAAAGCGLGVLAGWATSVRRMGPSALAKAGVLAAMLWVVGIGARLAFSLYVQNGGAATVRQFSLAHHISGGPAWGTGFVLMALAEVTSRTGVLYLKARRSGATIERGGLLGRFATAWRFDPAALRVVGLFALVWAVANEHASDGSPVVPIPLLVTAALAWIGWLISRRTFEVTDHRHSADSK